VSAPGSLIAEGVRVLTEPDTTRTAWLELRRTGIGGSDALAVAGLDPWRSPLGVWLDKTGHPDAPQVEETPLMRWGHILEAPLSAWFTAHTGIPAHRCGMLGHPNIPWQLYTPDRLAEDDSIVEFKTTSQWNASEWEDGKTSDRAEIQVQHGMSVTGKRRAYVVVGIWGQEPEMRIIERDDALIADLVKIETEFWAMVQSMTPPALTGHPGDSALLTHLHPYGNPDQSVELSPAAYEALRSYRELTGKINDLEASRDAARALVCAEMGDASIGTWMDRQVVTWRNTGPVNENTLRTVLPELADQYTVTRDVLDTKSLYTAMSELIAPYRSRRFLSAKI
jgi:putative phage-type endonuclease